MKIRRNILLFKLHFFLSSLWPLLTLAIVYFQEITGSYALALGVLSIANIVRSISEVPTGIISDKIGRRRTMIVGAFGVFLTYLIYAAAGNLSAPWLLLVGGVVSGIASAFVSGTDDAFMYETMQELRKADKYDILFARSKAFGQIGLAVGALVAALVTYFYSLNVLAWVSVAFGALHLFVTFWFVEPTVCTQEDTTSIKHFIDAWRKFMRNKKLQGLALLQMLNHGAGYASHSFEGVYFNMLIPTWMVNVARVLKQVCGTISYSIAPYVRGLGFYRILIGSTVLMTVIKFFAVVLNNFATPFIQSCVNLFHGTSNTASSALIQKELSSAQRATMGSIVSLLGGIMSAVIYFLIGVIADISSVYFAIIFLLLFNFVISGGYYWMLKHDK